MLNLKHLYYFHVFTQDLSTTAAAKRLLISVPALSNQLKQLEHILGSKLIKRTHGKVVLTQNGKMIEHYADRMFSVYEELNTRISLGADSESDFRVGLCQNFGARFSVNLLSLIADSRIANSHKTCVTRDTSEKLFVGFKEQNFDLVMCAAGEDSIDKSFGISKILDFPVRLFVSKNIAFNLAPFHKKVEKLDLDALIALANKLKIPFVQPAANTALRKETDHFLLNLKVMPAKTIECNNSDIIVQLVEGGYAMGFFPFPSLLDFKSAESLTILGPPGGYWTHKITILATKAEGKLLTNITPLAKVFFPDVEVD